MSGDCDHQSATGFTAIEPHVYELDCCGVRIKALWHPFDWLLGIQPSFEVVVP